MQRHSETVRGWRSEACRNFVRPRIPFRALLPGAHTRAFPAHDTAFPTNEDLKTKRPPPLYRVNQPIVQVPLLGITYVENRRAASETIRHVLSTTLNASWNTCGHGSHTTLGVCHSFSRCSSSCTVPNQSHFTFSFVREPVTRFYSGLEVYLARNPRGWVARSDNLTDTILQVVRRKLIGPDTISDAHLHSQVFQLQALVDERSDAHPAATAVVRLDFLGDVKALAGDFWEMMLVANASDTLAQGRLGAMDPGTIEALMAGLRTTRLHNSRSRLKARIRAARTPALDRAVAATYAQDAACLFP